MQDLWYINSTQIARYISIFPPQMEIMPCLYPLIYHSHKLHLSPWMHDNGWSQSHWAYQVKSHSLPDAARWEVQPWHSLLGAKAGCRHRLQSKFTYKSCYWYRIQYAVIATTSQCKTSGQQIHKNAPIDSCVQKWEATTDLSHAYKSNKSLLRWKASISVQTNLNCM